MGMKTKLHGKHLKGLNTFSLDKKRLKDYARAFFKYLKDCDVEDSANLLSAAVRVGLKVTNKNYTKAICN